MKHNTISHICCSKIQTSLRNWAALSIASALLIACSCTLWIQPARCDDDPSLLKLEQQAFNQAVAASASCVVQIETFGGLERVGDEVLAEGPTTGTIVAADGWIVSSLYSFRQQPASILVKLPQGERVAARVVARDFSREIALLKVDIQSVDMQSELPAAVAADIDAVRVGEWSIALGKTYDPDAVSQSVGIISAMGRAYGRAIQTDAKVSPINYGGPLVNLRGEVIGVLAPITPGTFFESSSAELYDSGIGFAIPLVDIIQRLPIMQQGIDIHPGKLGVVSSDQNELAGPVRLTGATPGSPAARAGLQAGDTIVEAGGHAIQLLADLRHALAKVDAGNSIQLTIDRGGQRFDVECELVKEIPPYFRRYLGLRLEDQPTGPIVTAIMPGSPAEQAGSISVGDRVASCKSQEIRSTDELLKLIAVAELGEPLNFVFARDAETNVDVNILPTTWPAGFPEAMPAAKVTPGTSETTELTLGDVPNQAFTIRPSGAATGKFGLLIIFPEPGKADQQKVFEHWQKFCDNYGWIVAVIQSGNARAWTMEEIELAGRVISKLDQTYDIDPLRTVVGGWGVGGRIAIAAGVTERKRVQGVLALGTDLRGLELRTTNAPLESLDFLFVGDTQQLEDAAQALTKQGYGTNLLQASIEAPGKWDALPMDEITLWLEGLGRL